jgi:hypothetical protein
MEFQMKEEPMYIEMRFFMMPRDVQELDLHIDFAQALMSNCSKLFNNDEKVKFNNTVKDFKKLKLKDCISGMKRICEEIGIDYQRLIDNSKQDSITQRFKFGKNYLV